jgi:hypothetical protein
MSAFGTKQTSVRVGSTSAFGGKAGIIGPEGQCPLMTQSGHQPRHLLSFLARHYVVVSVG